MITVYFIGYIFLLFAMNMSPENENELVTYIFLALHNYIIIIFHSTKFHRFLNTFVDKARATLTH